MALTLVFHEVSDLTLGKPSLPWLASTSTVRDAITALKLNPDAVAISVWDCKDHHQPHQPNVENTDGSRRRYLDFDDSHCCCVGKICMLSIVCYLASDENLRNLSKALESPISSLLLGHHKPEAVQHLDPRASLWEALSLISACAENIVIPINAPTSRKGRILKNSISQKHYGVRNSKPNSVVSKSHNGREYCWLTHEDIVRFLLGSIGVFSPLPMMSIKDLGIIQTDVLMVGVNDDAISAISVVKRNAMAVAVVERSSDEHEFPRLVGEISCSALQTCNESAALALATLSVGEFLVYIQDYRNPPHALIENIQSGLEKKLELDKATSEGDQLNSKQVDVSQIMEDLEVWDYSSDEGSCNDSPNGPQDSIHKWHPDNVHSHARIGHTSKSRNGPISCRPTSSLIAVILQALAHREQYVWVTQEDNSLVGIITFGDILNVLSDHLKLAF